MDDELKKRLSESGVEVLDWLKGAAEQGGDFVAEQAPLLAAEIVAWHFWSNLLLCLVCVLASVACFAAGFVGYWVASKAKDTAEDIPKEVFGTFATILCPVIGLVVLFIGLGVHGHQAVKSVVAPRVVLIEYAGKVLGK